IRRPAEVPSMPTVKNGSGVARQTISSVSELRFARESPGATGTASTKRLGLTRLSVKGPCQALRIIVRQYVGATRARNTRVSGRIVSTLDRKKEPPPFTSETHPPL